MRLAGRRSPPAGVHLQESTRKSPPAGVPGANPRAPASRATFAGYGDTWSLTNHSASRTPS